MRTIVEFSHIDKFFPGVRALKDVSFCAESGEVYAFLGENGAGKSTLLKILNGDYKPDRGSFTINGEDCRFESPKEAIDRGVSVIYQERQIVMEMTVAENVFLGSWPKKTGIGLIDFDAMNRETRVIVEKFGLNLNPESKVGSLSIAEQQMVEIMKAVNRRTKVIAFDEPTSSMSENEIDHLFSVIRQLQDEGKVIFYVSHRMDEIARIARKIVIFKDGRVVSIVNRDEVTDEELIRLMVGRPLDAVFKDLNHEKETGPVVLEVRNLSTPRVKDISFSVRNGEILGFSGLVGAGRSEIMAALFGLDKVLSGEIFLNGVRVQPGNPAEAIRLGIAMVPEDRKLQGCLPNISVKGNISIAILGKLIGKLFGRFSAIRFDEEERIALKAIREFSIKTPDTERVISQLSGGNQQKTILARWLQTAPKVLILDEPTKGIDVGAKAEFYKIINDCAQAGMAVIVISSELPEIIGLSDRIIVIRNGKISGEIPRSEATEERILGYAMEHGR